MAARRDENSERAFRLNSPPQFLVKQSKNARVIRPLLPRPTIQKRERHTDGYSGTIMSFHDGASQRVSACVSENGPGATPLRPHTYDPQREAEFDAKVWAFLAKRPRIDLSHPNALEEPAPRLKPPSASRYQGMMLSNISPLYSFTSDKSLGTIYVVRWKQASYHLMSVILPMNKPLGRVGVSGSLRNTTLLTNMPPCYIFNERTMRFEWSKGFENGEHLIGDRKYLAMYIDKSSDRFPNRQLSSQPIAVGASIGASIDALRAKHVARGALQQLERLEQLQLGEVKEVPVNSASDDDMSSLQSILASPKPHSAGLSEQAAQSPASSIHSQSTQKSARANGGLAGTAQLRILGPGERQILQHDDDDDQFHVSPPGRKPLPLRFTHFPFPVREVKELEAREKRWTQNGTIFYCRKCKEAYCCLEFSIRHVLEHCHKDDPGTLTGMMSRIGSWSRDPHPCQKKKEFLGASDFGRCPGFCLC